WGRGATRMLLGQGHEIDGIFCGSDQIARGTLDILRESGRVVPEDVAVVGFDNWEVFAKQSRPQLTSVDMRLEELGSLAAKTLFNILDGEEVSGVQSIDCRLMFRESTAPL